MQKRPMYRVMAAGVMVTVLGVLSPGRAQIDPAQLAITNSNILQTIQFNNFLTQKTVEEQAASTLRPRGSTTFRPNTDVRRRNLAQFVARTRAADPRGAAELERLFATTDLIGDIGKALAPYGLKTNDVADAVAVYIVTAWYGVRGRDDDPSRAQLTAVRGQMANALASTPQFASATDAQKQELAEAMLIQAALVSATVAGAEPQPARLEQVKQAVAQGAEATFGIDLRRLQLTDQGLQGSK